MTFNFKYILIFFTAKRTFEYLKINPVSFLLETRKKTATFPICAHIRVILKNTPKMESRIWNTKLFEGYICITVNMFDFEKPISIAKHKRSNSVYGDGAKDDNVNLERIRYYASYTYFRNDP